MWIYVLALIVWGCYTWWIFVLPTLGDMSRYLTSPDLPNETQELIDHIDNELTKRQGDS